MVQVLKEALFNFQNQLGVKCGGIHRSSQHLGDWGRRKLETGRDYTVKAHSQEEREPKANNKQ